LVRPSELILSETAYFAIFIVLLYYSARLKLVYLCMMNKDVQQWCLGQIVCRACCYYVIEWGSNSV